MPAREQEKLPEGSEGQANCPIHKPSTARLPESSGSRYYKIQTPEEQRRLRKQVDDFLKR